MIWKSDMFTFSFLYNWQLDKIQESNKKIEGEKKKKTEERNLYQESSMRGKQFI